LETGRKVIRQERLQKFGRILARRYKLNVELQNISTPACTDSTNSIVVKTDIDSDAFVNLIAQKTMILHEIGHVLYTSNKLWKQSTVDKNLINIIEDGRVEELISRKYPKARLYFIYTNQKLLPFKQKEPLKLDVLTMELIFREAKKTTGVPQLPPEIHKYLKENLGDDYDWFLKKTREAVETKSKKQLLALSIQMDEKLNKRFPKQNWYSKFPKVSNTPTQSISKCGNTSLKSPELSKQDNELVKKLVKQLNEQAKSKADSKEKTESKKTGGEQKENTENKREQKSVKPSEESKEKEEQNNNILESVENKLQNESTIEIRQESEILSSGVADKDFSAYGDESSWYWGRSEKPIPTGNLELIANRIAHLFKTVAQTGDGWNHNQTRGKLEMHKITSILSSSEQPRIFKRKEQKEKVDLSAVILLDASGSMRYRSYKATQSAYIISKALELGKYKSEVIQFFSTKNNFIGLKSFNQKLDYARKQFKPMSSGGTPLFHALKGAEKSLGRLESNRKIIIVVTDGRPHSAGLCKKKIREIEQKGIIVMGILIQHQDWGEIFNPKHKLNCDEVEQLPPKMTGVIKEVLMTIKRR